MSAQHSTHSDVFSLCGREGELVSVRVVIEPKLLEELLEALAGVAFPINPEIFHGWPTTVEFPAYRSRLAEIRQALQKASLPTSNVQVASMLDAILS